MFFLTANTRGYAKAEKMMSKGQYSNAAELFKDINGYKDSNELYKKSMYEYGKQLQNKGDYKKSAAIFDEIKGYSDSSDLLKQTLYKHGLQLMETEEYDEATSVFEGLFDYQDSEQYKNECIYKSGILFKNSESYDDAIRQFSRLDGYKDSDKMLSACKHLSDVQKDKIPPVINGLEEGSVVEVDYLSVFNIKEYFMDKISVKDEFSGEISEYTIQSTANIYNSGDGSIDTSKPGNYDFVISAVDEGKNEAKINFVLFINDIIRVTAENATPVIFDDKQVKITVQGAEFGSGDWGANAYRLSMLVENQGETPVYVYPYDIYVNDFKVSTYGAENIEPGKNGVLDCGTYVRDISEAGITDVQEIQFTIGISFDSTVGVMQKVAVKKELFQ